MRMDMVLRGLWGWWEVGMVDRWGWRWIYRKTGGVAEMKDNDVKGGSFHAFYEDEKRKFYVIIEI